MTNQHKKIGRSGAIGVAILSSALLLSACSTLSSPFSSSKTSQSAQAAPAASEDMDAMRAQCMAMHDKMKAKMAEGGEMMSDGMMSDEMKAKHKKCMEAMPEMREKMHEQCMSMKMDGTGDGMMMGGDMKKMHEHCMQMMHGDDAGGDDAAADEGEHQH